MKEFRLTCHVTVSAFTSVKAETLEQALKIAEGRTMAIGGTGSSDEEDEWIVDEIDGLPEDIRASDSP